MTELIANGLSKSRSASLTGTAMVEELESTSMTILAFSSFVLYVPFHTISSPLELGGD